MKSIADAGCKVIVCGGKAGELYIHYCNKYSLMVVRLMSKFDIRRLCKAIGATPLPRLVSSGTGSHKGADCLLLLVNWFYCVALGLRMIATWFDLESRIVFVCLCVPYAPALCAPALVCSMHLLLFVRNMSVRASRSVIGSNSGMH